MAHHSAARRVLATLVVGLLLAGLSSCSGTPSPTGIPDPGHRLLAALRPVANATPPGVSQVSRSFSEPIWDSCDGVKSSFGWDDVTVNVSFNSNGISDTTIFDHIKHVLQADGWVYDSNSSGTGAWEWHRDLAPGHHAQVRLLGGAGDDPPNPWDLQATTPPDTHPVKGC